MKSSLGYGDAEERPTISFGRRLTTTGRSNWLPTDPNAPREEMSEISSRRSAPPMPRSAQPPRPPQQQQYAAPQQYGAGAERVFGVKQMLETMTAGMRSLYGEPISDLATTFAAIDADADGYLQRDEFKRALVRLDMGLTVDQMDDLLRYMDTDRDDMISYPEFCAAFRWMVGLGAGEVLPERVEGMGTTLGRRLSSVGSSTTQQQIQQMAQLRAKQARMEEIPERSRGEVQYGEDDDGTAGWSSRVGPGRGAAGPQTRYATTEASSRYGVTSSHEQPSSQVAWAEGGSAYADARDGRGGRGGNDANRLQQVYSPERDALSRSLLASASSFGSGAVGGSGERADEFAGGEAYNTGGGGGIGGMGDQQQRKPNVHVNRHGSIDVSLSRDQVARLGLSGSLQGGYQQHHQQQHQQSSTSSSTTTSGDMMRAALSPLPDARSHGGGRSALAGTSSSSASFHATSTSMAMNSTTAARSPPRAIAASGLQMAHRFTRVQVPPFKEASVAQMVASYVTELQEQVRSSGSGLRVMYQKWSQEGFVSMSPTKRADESDGSTRWFSLLVVVAASGENKSALKDTAWQDDLAQRFGAIGIAAPAFLQLEPGARR